MWAVLKFFMKSREDPLYLPYMGNICWTIQVKATGKEKFGKPATVSAYAKYIFSVSVNIGEENFGK